MKQVVTFTTSPGLVPLPDGVNFRLNGILRATLPDGSHVTVPDGFKTDLASVPPLGVVGGIIMALGYLLSKLLALVGGPIVLLGFLICIASAYIKAYGKFTYSAVFHDWMFKTHHFSFTVSNWFFLLAMKGEHTALWVRSLMWFNVQVFGFKIYKNDKRVLEKVSVHHVVHHPHE